MHGERLISVSLPEGSASHAILGLTYVDEAFETCLTVQTAVIASCMSWITCCSRACSSLCGGNFKFKSCSFRKLGDPKLHRDQGVRSTFL